MPTSGIYNRERSLVPSRSCCVSLSPSIAASLSTSSSSMFHYMLNNVQLSGMHHPSEKKKKKAKQKNHHFCAEKKNNTTLLQKRYRGCTILEAHYDSIFGTRRFGFWWNSWCCKSGKFFAPMRQTWSDSLDDSATSRVSSAFATHRNSRQLNNNSPTKADWSIIATKLFYLSSFFFSFLVLVSVLHRERGEKCLTAGTRSWLLVSDEPVSG